MDLSKLTKKSQEALQAAQTEAIRLGHQQVDVEHLLAALLSQEEGLAPRILEKAGRPVASLDSDLREALGRLPRASGPGVEPGKILVTPRLQEFFVRAGDEASQLKDDYISVEHLLLALTTEKTSSPVSRLLERHQITRDLLLESLSDVRGAQRVTSRAPEESYEALSKYGIDLVEEARNGKLDPVIGRDEEIRRTIRILSRKTKNNPVLIGEPGVGKTAIVEGLAQRILRGDVPEWLKDRQLFSL
jgi:ATP-dependent Clp protease ATP-binding subunit ClpB